MCYYNLHDCTFCGLRVLFPRLNLFSALRLKLIFHVEVVKLVHR